MQDDGNDINLGLNSALVLAAQQILSEKFGKAIQINAIDRLTQPGRRNDVYRCSLEPGNKIAQTFVIKKIAGTDFSTKDPDNWDVTRFFNDWAGAEFLNSFSTRQAISPLFYGGNLDLGLFVLEDLGEHHSLVGPLLEGDAASAEIALQKYADCLGKLHGMTTGKVDQYQTLYISKLVGLQPFSSELYLLETSMQSIVSQIEQLGVAAPANLSGEIQTVMDTISRPGPFLAYIHADPCPDNLFERGDHFCLIDFEFGHYGHALLDGVYPRMIFPSCWCANRIPPQVVARFENRYREELLRGCPAAQEDAVWETALANICGYTLLRTIGMHLEYGMKEDYQWGRASNRQRVLARLQAFILTTEELHKMPALQAAARQLLTTLEMRWPETPQLSFYPAFNIAE